MENWKKKKTNSENFCNQTDYIADIEIFLILILIFIYESV